MEAIYAIDINNGLSKDGAIPWKSKKDMTFFMNMTKYNIVIMGKNTYFSLPDNHRPLKNRLNVVLTHTPHLFYDIEKKCTEKNLVFTNNTEIYLSFMNHELLYILYQIYAPLSILSDSFTHYDLNTNNVRLYIPEPKKHIEYHYHYPDRVVKFNSKYIVKIIDYGLL